MAVSGGDLPRGSLPKGVCVSALGGGCLSRGLGCLPEDVCQGGLSVQGVSARMTDSCKNITLLIRDFFSKGEKYDGSTRVVLPILCSMPGGGGHGSRAISLNTA